MKCSFRFPEEGSCRPVRRLREDRPTDPEVPINLTITPNTIYVEHVHPRGTQTDMTRSAMIAIIVALWATTTQAQRPPEFGLLPDPGPNRIEVRFALGDKTARCKRFTLTAKVGDRIVISRQFASGFQIPADAVSLPRKDALDLQFKCGKHRWHFTNVGERAFLSGWWWVGTDYPPFQSLFQNASDVQDAVWIRYLIIDPANDSGLFVYRFCPAKLKDQKPGPCYEN
jgi:hypothetical protein